MKKKKITKWVLSSILVMMLVGAGAVVWLLYGWNTSNPSNYNTIGEIVAPSGFERIAGDSEGYANFLRQLPLKPKGSEVHLFTGGKALLQKVNYAVVDIPLISNWEQCADCCIRLRAEYLFSKKQYGRIHFEDVNRMNMSYEGGGSRKSFESYLRKVYGSASTYSLSHEMKTRKLKDMQVGDVFVYAARPGHKYGHAVMVVDVAQNKEGKKAYLLAEGATPAREIHVMRNLLDPFHSPWFMLDEDADVIFASVCYFYSNQLRSFSN